MGVTNDKYLFATGRLRSLEAKVLSPTDIDRMVDAKDAEEALKVFNDLSLADERVDMKDATSFEAAVMHDLGQLKDEIAGLTPDNVLLEWLFLAEDAHNVKLLLKLAKGELVEEKYLGSFSNLALLPLEKLKILLDGKNEEVSEVYRNFITEVLENKAKAEEAIQIDMMVDKAYTKALGAMSKIIRKDFVKKITEYRINAANIKTSIRLKLMDKPVGVLNEAFNEGGNLKLNDVVEVYGGQTTDLAKVLQSSIDGSLKESISKALEEKQLSELDKALEEYELQLCAETTYIAYGPEIVVAYTILKQAALKNIRLIMSGKVNDIQPAEIRQYLRVKQ
ncbi:MAG: V-type ATPase subunit [bacterium]